MNRLVFVYGTLKKGHYNNSLLKTANFLGEAETTPDYNLHSMGLYPAVTLDGETSIRGEVYEVSNEVLDDMYSLEGYTGERDNKNNLYNTVDIDTPYGKAEMFVMDKKLNQPIIKSGVW